MSWQQVERVRRLKKRLEQIALLSLVVDIAISATTVASLAMGQAYTVGIIFILNYVLTIVVIVSLALIAMIAWLSHRHRLTWFFSLFRFEH